MTVERKMMNLADMNRVEKSPGETLCSAVGSDQDLDLSVRRDVTVQGRSCIMEHTVSHTKSAHVSNQEQTKLYL